MRRVVLNLLLIFCVCWNVQAQKVTIENALYDLPDVIFKEIGKADTFELKIKQPLDHRHPEKGYFYQRAFLTHKAFNKPMVMYLSGYDQPKVYNNELSKLLNTNQLSIEHRYFGKSVPDSLDYNYLNLEQATADLHHINELFKKIYTGKWISTGISKGGSTTIFYKYFFPDDVDVAIPYVAPLNREYEDKRIYTFLDTVGSKSCRQKLFAFQKRMLKHRQEVLPLLQMYSEGAGLKFTYLTLEQAFEYSVLELPFAFWQYYTSSNDIPSEKSSLLGAVQYLTKVSNIKSFSDLEIDYFLSHCYQAATEMGYYGYRTEPFKNDLKTLPLQPHPYAAIVPKGIPLHFDDTLLKKANAWISREGNRMIYIYGSVDTWSATGVPPSDKVDAQWFLLSGKNHRTARFVNMNPDEKQRFIKTLERWGIPVENPEMK
jgi:PS-10 peptidase S37.